MFVAGELESALRWSAAAIDGGVTTPAALIMTGRILAALGRREASVEAFELGIRRSVDMGNLPLAVVALADLNELEFNVEASLDTLAGAFCKGSSRLTETAFPPPLPPGGELPPLSSFLAGPALLSKATQIVREARDRYQSELAEEERPAIAALPLFSDLSFEGLRALLKCFRVVTVGEGETVIQEGEDGAEAYIVARGELEVQRIVPVEDGEEDSVDGEQEALDATETIVLARLSNGALFGEMALVMRAPRAASVVAVRPSVLLVASRDDLEAVAGEQPEVGIQLAAHCRRRMVSNLQRVSPLLLSVEPEERGALVERFETRVFDKEETLIWEGADPGGLHIIASGEVAILSRDQDSEPVFIATLGPGDTVGETALVLRRKANASVVAVHPTVTLFLPEEEWLSLIQDHSGVLLGLYMLSVQRDIETSSVLVTAPVHAADDLILL
jgi:cAMP-dependent protein kinase regulator